MKGFQLCLTCSIHSVHCRVVLIYWLFTLSLEKKAQRKIEASVNQHASFSPVPPKSALCQVVLWTESVFFKFIVRALTAKVLCFERVATFWDPMDCSPPDYSVHGSSQARILEWLAVPFSRESSRPRDRTQVSHIEGRFFTIRATTEAH